MRRLCIILFLVFLFAACLLPAAAIVVPGDFPDISVGAPSDSPEPSIFPIPEPSDYLPPDQFFDLYGDDYTIMPMAVQSTPNTPVTSSTGFKGIMLQLMGPYDPTITQYRYQSNTSTNYTYVNDISPDYPWMISAAIFAIVLYCTFKLGGTLLCKV